MRIWGSRSATGTRETATAVGDNGGSTSNYDNKNAQEYSSYARQICLVLRLTNDVGWLCSWPLTSGVFVVDHRTRVTLRWASDLVWLCDWLLTSGDFNILEFKYMGFCPISSRQMKFGIEKPYNRCTSYLTPILLISYRFYDCWLQIFWVLTLNPIQVWRLRSTATVLSSQTLECCSLVLLYI